MKKFDYIIGGIALCAFLVLILENSAGFIPYRYLIQKINFVIFSLFAIDVLIKLFSSKDKKRHITHHWFDLIVFIPLIQFIYGIENTNFFIIIRQIVIVAMLISRVKKSNRFINLLSLKPAQLMIAGFAMVIGTGTVLLMLPISVFGGERISLIDALFTATSATCVTGLIVKDTGTYFSYFGQMVILSLIQLGGLGIMTFSVSLTLLLGKRVEMKQQVVMQDILDQDTLGRVKSLSLFIIKMTFFFELIGALALFLAWRSMFQNPFKALYYALFHSISAFCNAGFSTFSDSLIRFSGNIPINSIICGLIISGGLGFMVIREVYNWIINHIRKRTGGVGKLRIQTKIILKISSILILAGTFIILALEYHNVFTPTPVKDKILISVFQSVTTRTAGFNTCNLAHLSSATLFLFMLLMFIGASPGSTGGGIKTTTLSILWATLSSGFRQKEHIELHKRTIPPEVIQKAITLFISSLMIISFFALLVLHTEKGNFMDILFEVISAFGTVGLSTGITPILSLSGKLILTMLMFIGRLGPLTIGYAFLRPKKIARYRYAEERVMIG